MDTLYDIDGDNDYSIVENTDCVQKSIQWFSIQKNYETFEQIWKCQY